jgi:hypothetical protein
MKIYFAGSIRAGREDQELYSEIISHLKTYGDVLTEHVGNKDLTHMGEKLNTVEYIYQRNSVWLKEFDVFIAEVTQPSLGVGYEIAKADSKTQVLALYRPSLDRSLSALIQGSPSIDVRNYSNIDEARTIIDEFFRNRKSS